MSRIDEAKTLLESLQDRAPDLVELAIARTNGLIILSLQKTINQDKKSERLLGAMASALFSIQSIAHTSVITPEPPPTTAPE